VLDDVRLSLFNFFARETSVMLTSVSYAKTYRTLPFLHSLLAVGGVVPVIVLGTLLGAADQVQAQATHSLNEAFDFPGGTPVNPNKGWTFADGALQPLTNFVNTWNSADFGPGQPGWEGPAGAPHSGWAKITEEAVFFSGHDLVAGEIVTHGISNVVFTPHSSLGDPFTGHHSASIDGTIHHTREFDRMGPWFLSRNGNEVLASGTIDDSTLSFNSGPLNLAANATFISPLVTVADNKFTEVSYEPGDFFNLTMANNDFTAVALNVQTFAAPGKGFGTPVIRAQEAYYRFEEASGVDVFDSLRNEKHGTFNNTPAGAERSTDVPIGMIPQTGAPNTKAADLRMGGSILLNASKFIFDGATAGGPDGGATLEWYMKVPNDNSPDITGPNGHTSIFWTNGLGQDSDRFNIFWDANFTGAPDSDRFISGDWRAPGSAGPHNIAGGGHNNGNPLSEDAWHHVAIVRKDDTPGNTTDYSFTWNWYIDGVLSPNHTTSTTAPAPLPDFVGWTIAGRPGFPFYGLIDEVRLTASALMPTQFLSSMSAGPANPGDYNDDGTVNAADYVSWRNNVGTTNALANDAIGGTIGQQHYLQWRSNFGRVAGSASALSAVPEPASLAVLLIGIACATRCRALRATR
jgi:hypothetical protein